MKRIQYTGMNFAEIQEFTDNKVLAPYEGIGTSILSILTDDGLLTVNEGDWLVCDDEGRYSVE